MGKSMTRVEIFFISNQIITFFNTFLVTGRTPCLFFLELRLGSGCDLGRISEFQAATRVWVTGYFRRLAIKPRRKALDGFPAATAKEINSACRI
jgi:hypothetical protein